MSNRPTKQPAHKVIMVKLNQRVKELRKWESSISIPNMPAELSNDLIWESKKE